MGDGFQWSFEIVHWMSICEQTSEYVCIQMILYYSGYRHSEPFTDGNRISGMIDVHSFPLGVPSRCHHAIHD